MSTPDKSPTCPWPRKICRRPSRSGRRRRLVRETAANDPFGAPNPRRGGNVPTLRARRGRLEPMMAQATLPTNPLAVDLRGSPRKRRKERLAKYLLLSAAVTTFLITVLIIVTLFADAWDFFSKVDKSALWSIGWFPRRGLFDIKTLVVGTFIVTGIAMLVAVPLG